VSRRVIFGLEGIWSDISSRKREGREVTNEEIVEGLWDMVSDCELVAGRLNLHCDEVALVELRDNLRT
jgi:hypothetical protein